MLCIVKKLESKGFPFSCMWFSSLKVDSFLSFFFFKYKHWNLDFSQCDCCRYKRRLPLAAERLNTEAPEGRKTKSLTTAMTTAGCSEQGVGDAQHAALMPRRLLQETLVDPQTLFCQCLLAPTLFTSAPRLLVWLLLHNGGLFRAPLPWWQLPE